MLQPAYTGVSPSVQMMRAFGVVGQGTTAIADAGGLSAAVTVAPILLPLRLPGRGPQIGGPRAPQGKASVRVSASTAMVALLACVWPRRGRAVRS